jgi:predicted RNase H-like HicB family nuclease
MATYLEYIRAAMSHAQFEQTESGAWFAFIPGFDGLWASGPTRERAREELYESLDSWLDGLIKLSKLKAPEVDGLRLEDPPKLLDE